jgi:hypothetical protein
MRTSGVTVRDVPRSVLSIDDGDAVNFRRSERYRRTVLPPDGENGAGVPGIVVLMA